MAKNGKSNFRTDAYLAGQIERFVYEVVFLGKNSNSPLAVDKNRVRLIEHNENPETQMAGGDIVLTTLQKQDLKIDVKFASYYAGYQGKPRLETFSQELSYVKNNQWKAGWLVDPDKDTDVYAFGWVNSVTDDTPGDFNGYRHVTSFDQIMDCEIAFVMKGTLWKAVAKYLGEADGAARVSEESLADYLRILDDEARCFRGKPLEFKRDSLLAEPSLRHMRIHYTVKLKEMPVNLLFPRKILCSKEVAFHHLHCIKLDDGTWNVSDELYRELDDDERRPFQLVVSPRPFLSCEKEIIELGNFPNYEQARKALKAYMGNKGFHWWSISNSETGKLCDTNDYELSTLTGSHYGNSNESTRNKRAARAVRDRKNIDNYDFEYSKRAVGVIRDGKYIDDYGRECDMMSHDGYTAYFDEDNGWIEL